MVFAFLFTYRVTCTYQTTRVARTVCRCSTLTHSRGCADVVGSPGYTLSLLHTICVSGTGNHLTVAELEAQRMPAMT